MILQTGQDYAGRFQMVLLKQDIRMSLGLILMKIILVVQMLHFVYIIRGESVG